MALASLLRDKKGKHGATAEAPRRPAFRRQALEGSRGTSLSPELQTRARTTFGSDLSGVRVHTDDSASRSADHLSANAFTIGRDIYFNRNAYQPSRPEGMRLLGHELAHVVQQHDGSQARTEIATNPAPHENAADEAGRAFMVRALAKLARTASVPTVDRSADETDAYPIQREKKTGSSPLPAPELGEALDSETRTRTKFETQKTVLFGPADISSEGQIVTDGDKDSERDGMDDSSYLRRVAADSAPGIERHELLNVNHGTRILRDYYDKSISIKNLIVSSHGVYGANNFWVGTEEVTEATVNKLAAWKPMLNTDTKVVFTACNLGGGSDLGQGERVAKKLAETLGAIVYTNRSFSASAEDSFSGKKPLSWYGKVDDWEQPSLRLNENAYRHMGEWLQSIPPEVLKDWEQNGVGLQNLMMGLVDTDKDAQSVTNSPYITPQGEFGLAEDRFPWWSGVNDFNKYWKLRPE